MSREGESGKDVLSRTAILYLVGSTEADNGRVVVER